MIRKSQTELSNTFYDKNQPHDDIKIKTNTYSYNIKSKNKKIK